MESTNFYTIEGFFLRFVKNAQAHTANFRYISQAKRERNLKQICDKKKSERLC